MNSLSNIDTHELVSSKENIQPLRRGRDTSILCAALQAETNTSAQQELEKQRNEFEIRLRSNTNEDPLSDWCAYIHWIEQSFPKQGREGKLNVVLQKCINKFKDCERYMNDVRFVKICIKYADIEHNTVELLSQIHRHGIGVSCAELYITWAEKYAVDNCFKKANAIYERGLQCSAQPIELLKEAHQNFQAFLVRKMLNEKETFQPTSLNSNPTEVRQPYNVLTSLTTGHKEVVPSNRTGSNVLGTAGKLQQLTSKEQKSKNNRMIKIFEDSENSCATAEPRAKIEKVHSKKTITKENTIKPGPWTNKHNKNVPFKVDAPTPLSFEVHRDEEGSDSSKKPKTVPTTVLKTHKRKASYEDENFASAPLFYPDPYDPSKISMYCKEQVYAGNIEFQFEELRAIQYRRKREEELKRKKMNVLRTISPEPSEASAEPSLPTPNIEPESHSKPKTEKKKPDNESVDKEMEGRSGCRRKTLFTSTPMSESVKTNCVPELENVPNTDYSMNQTIHTKEALSEMQQLWFSKPASPVPIITKPMKPVAKSILKPSKPCFNLYVDESCLENLKTKDTPEKPLDLTLKTGNNTDSCEDVQAAAAGASKKPICPIYVDDEQPIGGVRKKTGLANKIKHTVKNYKENVFVEDFVPPKKDPCYLGVDDEDKENGIPSDYCGPVGKSDRKVSGILTPAENVEIAQLSDEEVEEDDNEDEEGAAGNDFSSIIQCNTTAITETWNFTKGFQFPRGESTPNVRKSFHNKEDCDVSVFVSESGKEPVEKAPDSEKKPDMISEKIIVLQSTDKKPNAEGENCGKNLSVIAETSREYRSSSSGSSGMSTLALRSSKNFPYTPSEAKTTKLSFTSSHLTFHKTKVQSYTGYEASAEYSSLKTPTSNSEKVALNTTYDLLTKLNAIESVSISENGQDQTKVIESLSNDMSRLQTEEKKPEENIDPFSDELIEQLLQKVDFPRENHSSGYFLLHDIYLPLPKIGSTVTLGADSFEVKKMLGKGSYAKIFHLLNSRNGEQMIAKYQSPAFPWEFYITREVQSRIQNKDLAFYFMHVETAFIFKNSSVLLTRPIEFGNLLSVINKMKQAKILCQGLAMYFVCQILQIMETLHATKIIHGDVKPDNLLLMQHNNKLQLQLIDFGRSIDMSLFPEDTVFTRIVTTEGFTTVEMQLGKPWTYQIDLYGVANCGHCLLFGEYMKVAEKRGVWNITKIIPRYWAKTEWGNFFVELLNVESCFKLPNLTALRESFEAVLENNSELELSLFGLQNLLNGR